MNTDDRFDRSAAESMYDPTAGTPAAVLKGAASAVERHLAEMDAAYARLDNDLETVVQIDEAIAAADAELGLDGDASRKFLNNLAWEAPDSGGAAVVPLHRSNDLTTERGTQKADRDQSIVDLLEKTARALTAGDWRTATLQLFERGAAGNHLDLVDIAFCQRRIARSMRLQSVLADAEAAREQLDAAIGRLSRSGPITLGVEPPRRLQIAHLRWVTTRLLLREQADLEALRLIFEGLPHGRQELVYAAVEHLTWIEFDPWTVHVHPLDRELAGLDDDAYGRWRVANRHDMCSRATRLRHFADVRSGSISERVWHRMGGYPHVREAALLLLAQEPAARGRSDFPVRSGRLLAWQYARQWVEVAGLA